MPESVFDAMERVRGRVDRPTGRQRASSREVPKMTDEKLRKERRDSVCEANSE